MTKSRHRDTGTVTDADAGTVAGTDTVTAAAGLELEVAVLEDLRNPV
jgi:hypothetical protein